MEHVYINAATAVLFAKAFLSAFGAAIGIRALRVAGRHAR